MQNVQAFALAPPHFSLFSPSNVIALVLLGLASGVWLFLRLDHWHRHLRYRQAQQYLIADVQAEAQLAAALSKKRIDSRAGVRDKDRAAQRPGTPSKTPAKDSSVIPPSSSSFSPTPSSASKTPRSKRANESRKAKHIAATPLTASSPPLSPNTPLLLPGKTEESPQSVSVGVQTVPPSMSDSAIQTPSNEPQPSANHHKHRKSASRALHVDLSVCQAREPFSDSLTSAQTRSMDESVSPVNLVEPPSQQEPASSSMSPSPSPSAFDTAQHRMTRRSHSLGPGLLESSNKPPTSPQIHNPEFNYATNMSSKSPSSDLSGDVHNVPRNKFLHPAYESLYLQQQHQHQQQQQQQTPHLNIRRSTVSLASNIDAEDILRQQPQLQQQRQQQHLLYNSQQQQQQLYVSPVQQIPSGNFSLPPSPRPSANFTVPSIFHPAHSAAAMSNPQHSALISQHERWQLIQQQQQQQQQQQLQLQNSTFTQQKKLLQQVQANFAYSSHPVSPLHLSQLAAAAAATTSPQQSQQIQAQAVRSSLAFVTPPHQMSANNHHHPHLTAINDHNTRHSSFSTQFGTRSSQTDFASHHDRPREHETANTRFLSQYTNAPRTPSTLGSGTFTPDESTDDFKVDSEMNGDDDATRISKMEKEIYSLKKVLQKAEVVTQKKNTELEIANWRLACAEEEYKTTENQFQETIDRLSKRAERAEIKLKLLQSQKSSENLLDSNGTPVQKDAEEVDFAKVGSSTGRRTPLSQNKTKDNSPSIPHLSNLDTTLSVSPASAPTSARIIQRRRSSVLSSDTQYSLPPPSTPPIQARQGFTQNTMNNPQMHMISPTMGIPGTDLYHARMAAFHQTPSPHAFSGQLYLHSPQGYAMANTNNNNNNHNNSNNNITNNNNGNNSNGNGARGGGRTRSRRSRRRRRGSQMKNQPQADGEQAGSGTTLGSSSKQQKQSQMMPPSPSPLSGNASNRHLGPSPSPSGQRSLSRQNLRELAAKSFSRGDYLSENLSEKLTLDLDSSDKEDDDNDTDNSDDEVVFILDSNDHDPASPALLEPNNTRTSYTSYNIERSSMIRQDASKTDNTLNNHNDARKSESTIRPSLPDLQVKLLSPSDSMCDSYSEVDSMNSDCTDSDRRDEVVSTGQTSSSLTSPSVHGGDDMLLQDSQKEVTDVVDQAGSSFDLSEEDDRSRQESKLSSPRPVLPKIVAAAPTDTHTSEGHQEEEEIFSPFS